MRGRRKGKGVMYEELCVRYIHIVKLNPYQGTKDQDPRNEIGVC